MSLRLICGPFQYVLDGFPNPNNNTNLSLAGGWMSMCCAHVIMHKIDRDRHTMPNWNVTMLLYIFKLVYDHKLFMPWWFLSPIFSTICQSIFTHWRKLLIKRPPLDVLRFVPCVLSLWRSVKLRLKTSIYRYKIFTRNTHTNNQLQHNFFFQNNVRENVTISIWCLWAYGWKVINILWFCFYVLWAECECSFIFSWESFRW